MKLITVSIYMAASLKEREKTNVISYIIPVLYKHTCRLGENRNLKRVWMTSFTCFVDSEYFQFVFAPFLLQLNRVRYTFLCRTVFPYNLHGYDTHPWLTFCVLQSETWPYLITPYFTEIASYCLIKYTISSRRVYY